jgi:hypothetical protein
LWSAGQDLKKEQHETNPFRNEQSPGFADMKQRFGG